MPVTQAISKARPDHPSIDFDLLRAEGIRHLEHFATEVWTDYNAHDPGITLLELLCYAITDLGYRTRKLPVEDLLADPDRQYKPWFSAGEVLPASPVTALDYRKLLIDVEGVKNAWLLPGNAELAMKSLGIVFPELSKDGTFELDDTKIKGFLEKYKESIFGNTIPDINDDYVNKQLTAIQAEIKRIADLKKIQPYIDAIGREQASLGNLAKIELRKYFSAKQLYLEDAVIEKLYEYININPEEEDLPPYPDRLVVLIRDTLLHTGISSYQILIEKSVEKFFENLQTSPEIKDALVDFFLSASDTISDSTQGTASTYSSIYGLNKDEKLNTLLLAYIRSVKSDDQWNKLADLKNFYINDLPYRQYFDSAFGGKYWDGGNTRWKLDQIAVESFLGTAFGITQPTGDIISGILDYYGTNSSSTHPIITYLFREKFCEHGLWGVGLSGNEPLPLNGLYTVLLDLDEHIRPQVANEVNPVLRRVREALQANRALCEDFVDIQIVKERPIALCLELEVDPEADEVEVFAEAIRLMQEYLSPVPRFRSFAQRQAELKDRGKNPSAEHVYNGPLLKNGFLEDAELGDAQPRPTYYHSDLLRIAMSVKGVIGLPALKVKEAPETAGSKFEEKTEYQIYSGDFATPAQPPYYKPYIDLSRSVFTVTKGARKFGMNKDRIEERLKVLRLINAPDPLEPPGGPQWTEGRYRPDLSDYRSLQYDLPATYAVGRHSANVPGAPGLKAQNRHLQAYLAFYDQILAAYLAQLGRVRRLLSVDQPADAPTRILPLLYEVPGIREMIGLNAEFTAEPADWARAAEWVKDDAFTMPPANKNDLPRNDRDWVREILENHFGENTTTLFSGFSQLREALRMALSGHPGLRARYIGNIEDYFWAKYTSDTDNAYARALREMAESPAVQQRRRNELLDHLIARFGESFSEYAVALLRPETEPEDNPRLQDFQEYLESKTAFLREVAALATERNRAYNYTAFDRLENVSDVWNTRNVSGLQKRVVRKLGIPSWETRSLIAEPAYRLDIQIGRNKRGLENYSVALRRRLVGEDALENPLEAVPLMVSPPYDSLKTAQKKINELYKIIWQTEFYKLVKNLPPAFHTPGPEDQYYWFTLRPIAGGKYKGVLAKKSQTNSKISLTDPDKDGGATINNVEILLETEALANDEAVNKTISNVMRLVEPAAVGRQNEGFYIVEHILLRPLEADDKLLQLHLGCVPEETPKDPYSFWITVVAPAETARFADPDFRTYFEHEFRLEMPAHISARFCYLTPDDMYKFEEAYAVWMFEKARCSPPNNCKVDAAAAQLVEVLNALPCSCACAGKEALDACS